MKQTNFTSGEWSVVDGDISDRWLPPHLLKSIVPSKEQLAEAKEFGDEFTYTDGNGTIEGYLYGGSVYVINSDVIKESK